MSAGVFNISKGAFVEKIRDASTNLFVMLLKVNQTDDDLLDHDTIAAMLAGGNTECNFTNYARKVGLLGTITVDDVNNRVDVDCDDQTWTNAGGGLNNDVTKAIFAYQEAAADANRIPMTHHDFIATTDGNDLTIQLNASGFARAAPP